MPFASSNSCLRIVAVALLVASAFSAGLSHAHSGGNLAHVHHSGLSTLSGHHSHAPADLQLLSAVSHMHVYLFGLEFTVPVKERSQDDASKRTELVVSRLVGDDFDTSLDATPTDWQQLPDMAQLVEQPIVVSSDCAMTAMAVDYLPLCDSARHERTGVLRI
jgi:hypothetical protein